MRRGAARGRGGRAGGAEFVEVLDEGFVLGVQGQVGLQGQIAVVVGGLVVGVVGRAGGHGGGGFGHGVEGEGGLV